MEMVEKIPAGLNLRKGANELAVAYDDNESYRLSAEFLRVLSPSAEVRGHGNPVVQAGKLHVRLSGVERVGNYAIKLVFDDGHDSGIYTWQYLYDLCTNQQKYWETYQQQLRKAGKSRDPEVCIVRLIDPSSCG